MDFFIAWCYAGVSWFTQLCLIWDIVLISGKNPDYLLFMTIRGEQREDADVKRLVKQFKKEIWLWMGGLFAATGIYFLLCFFPSEVGTFQVVYLVLWCTALILIDYKVTRKYTNRMYELKLKKGWGNPPKQSTTTVDTVVSRMKKSMPVSEIWFAIPAWICIGSFVWWFSCATEYKILLSTLIPNVFGFVFFCYMYHRISHGKLKVYSEDSEVNYALNRASKRAWTACIIGESILVCGFDFLITVFLYGYMKNVAEGVETSATFFGWVIFGGSFGIVALVLALFLWATGSVRKAKKELAAAANLSYAEDEDVYWRNGYYYNPNDTNSFVENRAMGIATNMATKWGPITKWVLIITLVLCLGGAAMMLPLDFGSVTAEIKADAIELKGCVYYKESLLLDDVSEVILLTERPELSRVVGTGTKRVALGDYQFKGYGNGKAMMDKEAELFLMVKRKNGKWFGFSVKDSEKMLECYEVLRR